MNTNYIKYGIIGALVIGTVALFIYGYIFLGILAILLAGIVVITLFWHEKHIVTMFLMKRNKFNSAENILNSIKRPERFPKNQEAYHYFMLGNIQSYKRNITKAEPLYRKALNTGLKSNTNQAIVKLNLAAACLTRRKKQEAQIYLRDVKKLDKYGILTDQVKLLEQQMKRV